jgi:hypothetical protein
MMYMKTRNLFSQTLIAALAVVLLGTVVAPYASAQCGYLPGPKLGFNFQPLSRQAPAKAAPGKFLLVSDDRSDGDDPIVGFWKVSFVAEGNNGGPPDGTPIDFGFQQWHRDGTEILNSGMRAPATGNFCLGVWKRTGRSKYKLNHFAISSAPDGTLIGPANVREEVVLDHDGDSFSGAFTIEQFDTHGNLLGGVKGVVTGTRIIVDTQP